MNSIKSLRISTMLSMVIVAFILIGLISRQAHSFSSRVFSNEPKQAQFYHQINDPEYEFINSLKLSALSPNQKHSNQFVSIQPRRHQASQLFVAENAKPTSNKNNNNEPDVADLLQQSAVRQARLQRSLSSNNDEKASQQTFNTKNQLQMYQDEQSFKRQLPDLIAQAHEDRVLERALLRMLINSSLSGSRSNANNFQRDSLTSSSNGAIVSGDGGLDGNENVLNKVQQAALDNYASLDPFVNDISRFAQQEGDLTPMDKREYNKPCLFNAIACPKNPFGRMHDI